MFFFFFISPHFGLVLCFPLYTTCVPWCRGLFINIFIPFSLVYFSSCSFIEYMLSLIYAWINLMFPVSDPCILFTQCLEMSASMLWARMSMMNLLVSIFAWVLLSTPQI